MLKKELHAFFSTTIGYITIALFIVINSLFLFVFKTEFNILDAGFADLNSFFYLSPWIFLFLIPSITMKSFSDEIQNGTLEILKTRPISNWQIVWSKFLSAFILVILMLITTLIYVYTIYQLSYPTGSIDLRSIIGAYIGLLFITSSFVSIGIFTSTLSKSQIIAFLIGLFISFLIFYGFEFIASIYPNFNLSIKKIGMYEHYQSISRGVLDTRDLIYFISVSVFFLALTQLRLKSL